MPDHELEWLIKHEVSKAKLALALASFEIQTTVSDRLAEAVLGALAERPGLTHLSLIAHARNSPSVEGIIFHRRTSPAVARAMRRLDDDVWPSRAGIAPQDAVKLARKALDSVVAEAAEELARSFGAGETYARSAVATIDIRAISLRICPKKKLRAAVDARHHLDRTEASARLLDPDWDSER